MRTTKPTPKTLLFVVALAVSALAVDVACSDVSLNDRACPCVDGYICCDDVCEQFGCSKKRLSSSSGYDDDTSSTTGSSNQTTALTSGKVTPQCMTADPSAVFWMNQDGIIQAGSTVSRKTVSSRINTTVTLVKSCSLLRSGDGLYVATPEANSIQWLSVSSDGANPVIGERAVTFATFNAPASIVQDTTYLYALDGVTGEVRRIAKLGPKGESSEDGGGGTISDAGIPDGGTVASGGTLLGTGSQDAYSLILAGDVLYWFDKTGLRRMPKVGGPVTTLASLTTPGNHLASDLQASTDALYWIVGGKLLTVPIAGGVAHELPFTPIPLQRVPVSTSTGDDDDTTPTVDPTGWIYTFAVSDRGLILGHNQKVGLLGFQGGSEIALFSYGSSTNQKMSSLLFDTSRFIWISGTGESIYYRPLLETDPKLP